MIDPFRYLPQEEVSLEVEERVNCERCAVSGAGERKAVRLCVVCERYKLLCGQCDVLVHRSAARRTHPRREVLIGKGYSKRTVRHGDRTNFPQELDQVKVSYTVAVTRHGKTVWKKNKPQVIRFHSGCSGTCVHVQVLGCDDLPATNVQGTSDPFCGVYWKDKFVEMTTTRYETRQPRWKDQTSVIPVDYEQFCNLKSHEVSHKEFLRIEVFARMLMKRSRLLGHATLEKTELSRLAKMNDERIVRLPITFKTTRGALGVRVGIQTDDSLVVQVVEGVDLDKTDIIGLSDPYVKVYVNESELLGRTPVQQHTLNPKWTNQNTFVLPSLEAAEARGVRFEVLDYDRFSPDDPIGDAYLSTELLQSLVQQLPTSSPAQTPKNAAGPNSPVAGRQSFLRRLSRRMSSISSDRRLTRFRSSNLGLVRHWSDVVFLEIQSEFQALLNKQKPSGVVLVRVLPSSRGEVIRGLDRAVKEMSLGERAVVHLRYDYAYGILCVGPAIPPKSTLIFRIQLLQINQKGALREVYRMFTTWRNRMRARVGLQVDSSADFMTQSWRNDARMSFSVPSTHSRDLDQWAEDEGFEDDDSKVNEFLLGEDPDTVHAGHEAAQVEEKEEVEQATQAITQGRGSQLDMYKLRRSEPDEGQIEIAKQPPDAKSPIRPDQLGFKTAAGIGAGAKRFFR